MIDQSQESKHHLKKEWTDAEATHCGGGARRWLVWVTQLICELLVYGTPPSTLPANIQTMCETLYGAKPDVVPSVNFERGYRVVVQVFLYFNGG